MTPRQIACLKKMYWWLDAYATGAITVTEFESALRGYYALMSEERIPEDFEAHWLRYAEPVRESLLCCETNYRKPVDWFASEFEALRKLLRQHLPEFNCVP